MIFQYKKNWILPREMGNGTSMRILATEGLPSACISNCWHVWRHRSQWKTDNLPPKKIFQTVISTHMQSIYSRIARIEKHFQMILTAIFSPHQFVGFVSCKNWTEDAGRQTHQKIALPDSPQKEAPFFNLWMRCAKQTATGCFPHDENNAKWYLLSQCIMI